VRVLFEELLSVISEVLEQCSTQHAAAERQFETFQTKIRAAMMGDDVEYTRVLEEDSRLDAEISRLNAKKAELQRQLDEVTVELQATENKKRQHNAQSHKIMSTYNQRMKSFAGDNQKMSSTYEKASAALQRTTKSKQFLSSLCESTISTIADKSQQTARVTKDMNRQVLVYLVQHLESSRDTVDLINRRFKFCHAKLDTMRTELQEAKDIGLLELASDLQSAVCKFESMQVRCTVRACCACMHVWSVGACARRRICVPCAEHAGRGAHAEGGLGCNARPCDL
jgi:chromosome segregation ATPase